jgi:hypothetical protein
MSVMSAEYLTTALRSSAKASFAEAQQCQGLFCGSNDENVEATILQTIVKNELQRLVNLRRPERQAGLAIWCPRIG